MKRLIRRPLALVVALGATLLAAGGIAWAAIPDSTRRDQRLLRELERQAPGGRLPRGLRGRRERDRARRPHGRVRDEPTRPRAHREHDDDARDTRPAGREVPRARQARHPHHELRQHFRRLQPDDRGDRGLLRRLLEPDRGRRRAGSRRGDRIADAAHAGLRRGRRSDVHHAGQRLAVADDRRGTSSSTRFASTASSSSSPSLGRACGARASTPADVGLRRWRSRPTDGRPNRASR